MSVRDLLEVYYNPKYGLINNPQAFRKRLGKLGVDFTSTEVRNFLNEQEPYQLFKHPVKNKIPVHAWNVFDKMELDLLDVSNEENPGVKFMFIAIDVFSRYVFAYPIKNKGKEECARALKMLVTEARPKVLVSDNESSFKSKLFRDICDDYDIKQEFVRVDDYKSKPHVERFNRTMRKDIKKHTTQNYS